MRQYYRLYRLLDELFSQKLFVDIDEMDELRYMLYQIQI